MPNTARQGHEKIGIFICWGVHNIEGEALWAAERYHNKLEGMVGLPHFQVGGECMRCECWIVFYVPKSLKKIF